MLVVITFLSLPVCQINDSFHHVELVQSRLSPFGRAASHVIFDLLSFAFGALCCGNSLDLRYRRVASRPGADLSRRRRCGCRSSPWHLARRPYAFPCCGRLPPTLPACARSVNSRVTADVA